jgi:hypothetical protein
MYQSAEKIEGSPALDDLLEKYKDSEDIQLNSAESVRQFYDKTVAEYRESLLEQQPELVAFDEQAEQVLTKRFKPLRDALEVLEGKFDSGADIFDDELERVQIEHDTAVHGVIELFESEPFDINTYITEQFAEHPYLIPSQRSPVYLLQREYKRALKEDATQDAKELAQQIKDHVDELVGNDTIAQEGVGANLESQTRRRGDLEVENLDPVDYEEGRRVFDGVDRISLSENNTKTEAIVTELYGMKLPTADDLYRFNAITFRDGLKLAMRHDTELSQLPEKQQLFAELLQLLEFVPTEGITAETSEQLHELAQKINDPNEAMQRTGVTKGMPVEVSSPAEVSTEAELSPEDQLQAFMVEVGVDSLEPEIADEAMDDLLREITPEEQLKKDLAEYGVEDLEPQLAEEAYVESDESEIGARAVPTSFTPAAVQEGQPSAREATREAREYKKKFKDMIKGIEGLDGGGFFARLVNAGQSPYEVLADMNFEDIVLSSQPSYVDSFNRSNYIKGLNVDHSAFENWMKLLPEIDDFSIETNGRTFKEVTDDLIEAQLKKGNTQST